MDQTASFRQRIRQSPVIAVLVIDDARDAAPLARALLRGGVRAIELTLRTAAAFEALERVIREVPDLYAGVGTILFPDQVSRIKAAGAAYGVSPGFNPAVVDAALAAGLAFAPGVATPSEIEAAYAKGCDVLKIFPVEPLGGVSYLKAIAAPYSHLGLGYIPLGGVSMKNLAAYLECPEVLAVGGSWLATRELIQAKDWDAVSRNCEEAASLAARVRG
ncbi:MAG TPA: bifunctional 4-hydroxy-2-oxoglutarate aldolase/2-dehydro-3-deoxy-phosphogluconate aldolase [Magnetospirillaceae bacterium]|nr:bifunctional 4-hydroxy-2-oxoglutarate aldolase/2-dehydro-3-deoxy-phosphogluconate aldolase [Magnetospirillaceae bacterium]